MAWNPSKEVKLARDAAQALGDAPMTMLFWVTPDGQLGMATYGRTKRLCDEARALGDAAWDAIMRSADRPGSTRTCDAEAAAEEAEHDIGDRIRLVEMPDDPDALPPGATGRITGKATQPGGWTQYLVDWDPPHQHRTLMLTVPPDKVERIERPGP